MGLKSEFFLAWRYFKPKRSAVSIITLISVIGVALGVAVLIVVLSVMTGFTDKLVSKLLETGAHLQVARGGSESTFFIPLDYYERHGALKQNEVENIVKAAKDSNAEALPVVVAPVVVQKCENFDPKMIVGFKPDDTKDWFDLKKNIEKRDGTFSLRMNEVIVGSGVASQYRLFVGSKILLHSPTQLAQLIERDPKTDKYRVVEDTDFYIPGEYTVTGIFHIGKYDYDSRIIFMNMDDADELVYKRRMGANSNVNDLLNDDVDIYGLANNVYIWTGAPENIDSFRKEFDTKLDAKRSISSRTWKEINSQIIEVLGMEKSMMFFLLVFIVLVAAFSITNTLITTVIQKTREIGLLKAMGASSWTVLKVFIMQGLFVGLIGTASGVLFGWLFVTYRMAVLKALRFVTGQEVFPAQIYLFDELPAHIIWSDVAIICVISILLCTCGALVPAFRAANLDPAKALRYE